MVNIEMRRVRLHLEDGMALDISALRGVMQSRAAGEPPVFDDQRSYVLHVEAASLSMDEPSLANLLTRHIFSDGKLTDLSVAFTADHQIALKGKLHTGVSVPFSAKAAITPTADGRLRLHVTSIKTAGVPAKGLMHVFGIGLDDVMELKDQRSVAIDGDDIVMDPGKTLPPPEIQGQITAATISGPKLALTFGPPTAATGRGSRDGNYIYFSGGTIRFGKLTMSEADLRLIDQDPRDPFDFFPAHYARQLVAGYSKNTAQGGLRTFMPDYDDLLRPKSGKGRPQ
jgi:hypothetical protein